MKWTMTLGHFLQMGGFKLNDKAGKDSFIDNANNNFTYNTMKKGFKVQESYLDFEGFRELLKKQLIETPETTAKEIEDRSKSDALSKGVALLQITWFIIQLIARAHQHLAITEIELTTAALAGLNSIMYLFWWNKPFGVRCPIIIRTKELERQLFEVGRAVDEMAVGTVDADKQSASWSFPVDKNGRLTPVVFDLTSYLMQCCKSRTNPDRVSGTQEEQTPSPIPAAPASNKDTGTPADPRSPKSIWKCCKFAVSRAPQPCRKYGIRYGTVRLRTVSVQAIFATKYGRICTGRIHILVA